MGTQKENFLNSIGTQTEDIGTSLTGTQTEETCNIVVEIQTKDICTNFVETQIGRFFSMTSMEVAIETNLVSTCSEATQTKFMPLQSPFVTDAITQKL